jgi:hypothetical protein
MTDDNHMRPFRGYMWATEDSISVYDPRPTYIKVQEMYKDIAKRGGDNDNYPSIRLIDSSADIVQRTYQPQGTQDTLA